LVTERVGFWKGTSTSAKLAMAGIGVTIIYGVVAGLGFSLGRAGSGPPTWWWLVISILQMTVPLLVVEVLVVLGLSSRKSVLHTLGVIGAGLLGLGAGGQGLMQTVVVIAAMVGGTVPRSVGPVVLVAALALAFAGAFFLVTVVVGWRETRRESRTPPMSTLGPA
jgi:hypothetical protein